MRKADVTAEARGMFPLVEEGVTLLRRAPAAAWACLLLGAGPFMLGLVRFWSVFSNGEGRANPVGWALALAGLHLWMRVWQSRFCAMLLDVRSAREAGAWRPGVWRRVAVCQLLCGMPCFLGMLPAMVVMIPFGWVFAFYQGLAVCAWQEGGARRAWAAARYAPYQNHLAMGWLSVAWLVLFLNVSATLVLLPYGVRWLFPVEWVFMKNIFWYFSTTFLCAVMAVTYLLFDPLVKAVYVLRVFYGLSAATGEDVRTDWRRLRGAGAAMALALAACGAGAAPRPGALDVAAEAVPVVPVEEVAGGAAALGEALAATAAGGRYAWRKPVDLTEHAGGWFETYVAKPVERFMERMEKWRKKLAAWLEKIFTRKDRDVSLHSPSGISASALTWLIAAGVALAGGVMVFLLWQQRRRTAGVGQAVAAPQEADVPDVADERVTAEVLAEDEWLRLAERLCAEGERRKAARAFFLACLACLARREWVTLKRFKTNADYLREMRRRALGRVFDDGPFCAAVGVFESGWYGEHPVTAEMLGALRVSVEAYRHG
ncbi:MAG: hypothetical protein FWG50_04520 [Kiritimatiellaeota bacterium]|nr:hypothetical protein [Kiritimatiellota bacterium]